MASYTPNINLKKPADGDAYDIADANGNMDAIDTAIGSLRESVSRFSFGNGYTVAFNDTAGGALRFGFSSPTSGQCNIMFSSSGLTVNYQAPGSSSWKNATLATW